MIIQSNPFPFVSASGDDGLLGQYLFENNLNDSSGNGRNATAPNGVTYVPGKIGTYAASLNGTNQYIELPALSDWDELDSKDFSCFFWFKSTDKSQVHQIIGNYSTLTAISPTPNQYWNMPTLTSGYPYVNYRRDNTESKNFIGSFDVCDDTWRLLGYVKDGTTLELWVNNVKLGSNSLSTEGSCANNQPVRIGVQYGRYKAMSIDNLRLYNRVLTTAEKTALYNE